MKEAPLISVCIPAYKNIEFLKRLLDSVAIQTFRDFEVIVTDDSPGPEVKALCEGYIGQFPISYFRNETQLGTPENWNEAVRNACGQWIKIIHDDDWLAEKDSLACFADAVKGAPEASFIFSAYRDIFLDRNGSREVYPAPMRLRALLRNNGTLFSKNIIGPPSVVLYRNNQGVTFDRTLKWVVDIDFYIRFLDGKPPVYIQRILLNVGLGSQQVTQDCYGRRPIEIPENFILLNKLGERVLRNLWVYDAWWRLMRKLEIRQSAEIGSAGYTGAVPEPILSMVRWQSKIPRRILMTGFLSKSFMFFNYLVNYNRIAA